MHPFGTHAIIGAAVAAARLSGFTVDEIAEVIELSAGLALASSQTAANSGASVRNAVTGLTAMNGVLAPILLRAGVTPEPDAVATVFGRVLGDNFDPTRPDARLGEDHYLLRNYFKIYACSRWNHAPIEATIAAMAVRQFAVSEISDIVVWTFDPATRLSWQRPVNAFAAKHSIPFNVAVRLVKNSNGLEAFTQAFVEDADICKLMSRIEVREDPAYT